MTSSIVGILAYGYDLQRPDQGMRFKNFGGLEVPGWMLEDADGGDPDDYEWKDFAVAAERRLVDAGGFHVKTAMGVQIETHGSAECEMFLLAAKVVTASRVTAEVVDLSLPDDAGQRLAWAVETLGLDVGEQKPRWLLTRYWG